MLYGSVCSGIEATSVAWIPLGLSPAWFSEIDPFCSSLLAHHYPGVKNLGDFRDIAVRNEQSEKPDILVGGTPCQSFSVSGKRKGLDDPRGNLAIEFCRLAGRLRPRWVLWENVPGVLSSNAGRDFGSILGALAELGYGCAWRVLDAQFVGVPQRRRRVFLVGYLGNWRPAAAVLFERESLCRNTPARRKAPSQAPRAAEIGPSGDRFTDVAPAPSPVRNQIGLIAFGGNNTSGPIEVATACNAHTRIDFETETVCVDIGRAGSLDVRRLTPRECERLQGFPDDYTCIPYRGRPAPDSLRYRAIGNSMAVPVMRWIGERILRVERLLSEI